MSQWELLSTLFTVLIEIDEDGVTRRTSPLVSEQVNAALSQPLRFFDDFQFKRPARFRGGPREALAAQGRLFLATCNAARLAVRGQIIGSDELHGGVLFVGIPWMAWMREHYPESEPQFDHFPVHDSQMDQLLLLSSQQTMVEDLQQLNRDLEDAKTAVEGQVDERQQFFNRVSHEVRTPLTGISSALTLLRDVIQDTDALELLSMAEASIDRASEVVNFALSDSVDPHGAAEDLTVATDLRILAEGVHALFVATAREKGVALTVEFAEDLAQQYWCADLLVKEVLINLVGNAVKFTSKGAIALDISLLPSSQPQEHTLLFQVSDSGPGIPVGLRDQVFAPFETGVTPETRTEGGTGLGLSSSESQVSQMGGTIAVSESRLGGALFTVSLPLRPCIDVTTATGTENESSDYRFTERVLLLDDSSINLMLNAQLLRSLGFEVTTATTGGGAIACAQDAKKPFDVALLDINLPDMTGYEVAENLARLPACSKTLLVALSAYAQEDERAKARQSGMTAFVIKPFKREVIARKLQRLLALRADDDAVEVSQSVEATLGFDPQPIREMLELLGVEVVRGLIASLRSEGRQNLEELQGAVACKDYSLAARSAHTLGSSSGALGLMTLSAHMRRIEHDIRANQVPSVEDCQAPVPLLDNGLEQLSAHLSEFQDAH